MRSRFAIARAVVEILEQRRLMAGVVINEFLASNNTGIVDQDSDHSDWIELRNTDATAVNLAGWSLADDAANLTKWQFPATTLAGNGYLLVYASGKNRAIAGQQLHTNFQLDGDNGEYLALVKPDGTTVADSYAPFPPQSPDISYGRGTTSTVTDTLIDENAAAQVKIPTAASSIDSTWRNLNFTPDGSWLSGTTGVGFDTSPSGVDYTPYIGLNVQSQMSGKYNSAYIRLNFNVADPSVLTSLHLKMRYDDGFIAYLNGTEISGARRNATGITPAWNSATAGGATHADADSIVYEDINISSSLNLLQPGANVLAIQGLNAGTSSSDLLISPLLTADRSVASNNGVFMATPTPGAANSTGTLGFVGDTHFSVDRGFFDAPFNVAITTNTAGAQIRYTLDGSIPTATTGSIYTTPIAISTTKTLRAAAFETGWTPTNVDTETYIFLNDVIHQTGTGLPASANWGHNGPDWAMDPNIVNNPTYAGTIVSDLKSVPSVSLVMPWNDWFGSGGKGIYISGSGVEKAASMEMISSTDPTAEFQSDTAVEIQGASSTQRWNNDKLSFRLTFKPPFGPSKLNEEIFTNPTLDNGAATKFDRLILDSMYDDSWMDSTGANRAHAKEVQDQFAADLQNLAGGQGPHGKFVQLYLNGLYWGMYYLHEEPDDSFAESYLGGNKDDYDVVKHNGTTVVAGQNTAASNYASMLTAVRNVKSHPTDANIYATAASKLDIVDFIDYMIVNEYIGNSDWASHNWYASFNRVDPSGRWRFHSWDAEISLRDVNVDVTGKNESGSPTEIQTALSANAEYRLKFADEVQRLLFNGGVLATAGTTYLARVNEIDRAIVGESARWGDNLQKPAYTRANWRATQDGLQANYFPQRGGILVGQFTSRGWLSSLGAPSFSQFGGTVSPGYQLAITKPSGAPAGAVIYYTLDGSDPRQSGGAINTTSAVQYAGPITLNVARRIKARVYNAGTWSAIIDATFLMPTLYPVRISELHYHPAAHAGVSDPETLEFIELVNTGSSTIDLKGVQITQFASTPYTFSTTLNLDPGQRIVVAQNRAAFQSVYGSGINLAPGEYTPGNLSNSGERIALLGPLGETLQDFTYGDSNVAGWPASPDGGGPSLEITDPLGDPSDPANWHASYVNGGTPGTVELPPVALSATFVYDAVHGVRVQFDHDLDQSSVTTSDIDIAVAPGGSTFHPSAVSFPDSKTALFSFATPLPDGNYHATVQNGSIKDTAGLANASATDLDFFALNGDANHDRHVDDADQAILTAHLNQTGNFSAGDFDLNGTVDSADQAILTAQFRLWLPPVGALSLPATDGNDAFRLSNDSAGLLDIDAGGDVTPTYRLITAGVTSIAFVGGIGDDLLTIDASNGLLPATIPINFDGGNEGTDVLAVIGSTDADSVNFSADTVALGATITYAGVERRTFASNGGGDDLTIGAGVVALAGNASFDALVINPGATLDVGTYAFAEHYTGASPLDAIEANIQLGRAGGTWSGVGIVTTAADAQAPSTLATLGVAEASGAADFGGLSTAAWDGMTIDSSTVLLRYTYTGDANLDGSINGDDYFLIDSHFGVGPASYAFGDFDHNNRIDADDYFLIDSNYGKSGVVLLETAQPQNAQASAVKAGESAFAPDRAVETVWSAADPSAYKRLLEDDDALTLA